MEKSVESMRETTKEHLVLEITVIHANNRTIYGSPRITATLRYKGIRCSKNRVDRRMRENGIVAKTTRRFKVTMDSKHRFPI